MRIFKFLAWFSLFLLLLSFATFKVSDPDIMQYLSNGRLLFTHGFAVNLCNFNYFPHTCQLTDMHEWLFHLTTYVVYLLGQWNGLVIFQVLINVVIFVSLFVAAKVFKYHFLSAYVCLFLALFVLMDRFMLRADLLGILLLAIFYIVLRYYLEGKFYQSGKIKKFLPLAVLFLIQILWTNVHGSAILSFPLIVSYMVTYVFEYFFAKNSKKKLFFSQQLMAIITIFLLCLFGSIINPFGIKLFFDFFNTLSMTTALSQRIIEWHSPFLPSNLQKFSISVYKDLLIISAILLIVNYKKIRFQDLFLLLFFGYFSIKYVRNMALFAVIFALIIPWYIDRLMATISEYIEIRKQIILIVQRCLLVLLTIISFYFSYTVVTNSFYIQDGRNRRFGLGLSTNTYPIAVTSFIDHNNIKGNMFNDYIIGTYLNWKFFQQRKTFIDGHTFSIDSLDYYTKIMTGVTNYNNLADTYAINFFVLNHISPDTQGLINALYNDPGWKLIYFDDLSVLFIRNTPQNQSLIDTYAIDFSTGKNFDPNQIIQSSDALDISESLTNKGTLLETLGLYSQANYEFKRAISFSKENFVAYDGLGNTYLHLNNPSLALQALKNSERLASGHARIHFDLGYFYMSQGEYYNAVQEFDHTLWINSSYPGANYLKGIAYEKLGNVQGAIHAFQTELRINPNFSQAQTQLNLLR